MAISQIPDRRLHSRSIAKFTLAQTTLEALLMPTNKAEDGGLPVMQDKRQEESEHDPLGPAKGIVNGLRLSVTLWSFIALAVLLMR